MYTILWPLGIFVLCYGGLPLLIYSSQKMEAKSTFVPIDPASVPAEVGAFFRSIVPELEREGFRVTASLGMPKAATNVQNFLVMFVNRASGDKAMVTVAMTTNPNAPTSFKKYLEFNTRFSGGECFDTSNITAAMCGAFRTGAQDTKTRLSSVQDPHLLYQIHRFVMQKKSPQGRKVLYKDGEAVEYLSRVMVESYEEQATFGRLFYDKSANVFRPTIPGAYAMTWAMLWPMPALRKLKMDADERRILDEFRATQGATLQTS